MDYSYGMMQRALDKLVIKIQESGYEYNEVYGISRGGVIPGLLLSYKLKLRFKPLAWSLRDNKTRDVIALKKLCDTARDEPVLLVDDLVDSGDTIYDIIGSMRRQYSMDDQLNLFSEHNECKNNLHICTLLFNKDQKKVHRPKYCYEEFSRKERPEWINFWWERVNE